MLVEWGVQNEKRWPITVLASIMGRLVYEHLKFETICTVYSPASEEEEKDVEEDEQVFLYAIMERLAET